MDNGHNHTRHRARFAQQNRESTVELVPMINTDEEAEAVMAILSPMAPTVPSLKDICKVIYHDFYGD